MVIDFTQPSQLRQFKIIVEGRNLYVNQHYMAELSPYFLALCFQPGFREASEGRVEITDISFDDMDELLHTICPNDDFMIEPRISAENFALLTHLSGRLLLTNLRRELERYIGSDTIAETWINENTSTEQLIEISVEIIAAKFKDESINVICKHLAKREQKEVTELLNKIPHEYKAIIEPKVQGYVQYFKLTASCHQVQSSDEPMYIRLFF